MSGIFGSDARTFVEMVVIVKDGLEENQTLNNIKICPQWNTEKVDQK